MQSSLKPVIFLTSRMAGTVLVIWAAVISLANGYPLALQALHPSIIPLLLVALGVRLCVLPPNLPGLSSSPTPNVLGILLLLAPQAANLVVLSRIASLSVPVPKSIWLLGIALVALFSSIAWFSGSGEYQGRGYWLLAASGLALAASSQALPGAVQAWGIALQLSGALMMMASLQIKALRLFLILGGLSLSSLPFTLTWQSVWMVGSPFSVSGWILLLSQLFLLAGYLRFALQKREVFSPFRTLEGGNVFHQPAAAPYHDRRNLCPESSAFWSCGFADHPGILACFLDYIPVPGRPSVFKTDQTQFFQVRKILYFHFQFKLEPAGRTRGF